jgi:glycosyltransferase involved in cell wall biosynthesis
VSRGLFLSWAPFSRRCETLAQRFDLELRFISTPWPKRPLTVPLKYPWQTAATVRTLLARAHDELWVMDPPTPAVLLVGLAARLRRRPLVVDMHTVAFTALAWRLLRALERPLLRRAAAVVVTNEELAAQVRSWGARAFVLPDPLPEPPADLATTGERREVTVIATFSKDEPLWLLPEVARRRPDLRLAVTGAARGDLSTWPPNLRATGFLSERAFWEQLERSSAIVVLTTRAATLLSGGYEALVLARPLVTSDHAALREYFGDAAVYADDDVDSLTAALSEALDRGEELAVRLRGLARRRATEWERAAAGLRAAVGRV